MPVWLVRFDEAGRCISPLTRDAAVEAVSAGGHRHVVFFAHGWNTDYDSAVGQYRAFLRAYEGGPGTAPAPGSTLFLGVTWPSVWLPGEAGPQMAGAGDPDGGAEDKIMEAVALDLVATVPDGRAERAYELLDQPRLAAAEARELAELVAPAFHAGADELGDGSEALSTDDLLQAAAAMGRKEGGAAANDDLDHIGTVIAAPGGPAPAGGLAFDPRDIVRLFSLYRMKDRAGAVGARGVASLMRELLGRTKAKVHAVGHSFGCKVMLSALCSPDPLSRRLDSLLLLQPAISHLSFAETVPGRSGPGGYRAALDRVVAPILTTYSGRDWPLHGIFHLALRRAADLGDARIAGGETAAGAPPSRYAALGGYGPRGANERLIDPIPAAGEAYPPMDGARLIGLDGTRDRRIPSHGGVANAYTAWALHQQTAGA